jgi:nitrogen fixation protein FixH
MSDRRLDHKIWPVGIIIVMTAFVAIMMAMVTIAVENRSQLVSNHYYAEGYNLKQLVAEQAKGAATGWKIALKPLPPSQADMPLLQLNIAEANNQPCDSLQGEVALYRPSDEALDIEAAALRPMGAGTYFIVLPRALEHGAWQAVVHLMRGAQELRQRADFFVEN